MRAIYTKFIPATNYRAARIKAYSHTPCNMEQQSISILFDCPESISETMRHYVAAKAFADKFLPYATFDENAVFGGSPDGRGYVFCFPQSTVKAMA